MEATKWSPGWVHFLVSGLSLFGRLDAEVGEVTLKNNGDEGFNAVYKIVAMKR
jgi:hypothetical protein